MTRKSLFVACILTLSAMGIASAKSYDVTLGKAARAGAIELKPGNYAVKLVNGQAVFTREVSGSEVYPTDATGDGKPINVPVTVEHAGKKFSQTSLQTTDKGGAAAVQEIDLGGTDTKLVFGQ
jgi:hypothetical protein